MRKIATHSLTDGPVSIWTHEGAQPRGLIETAFGPKLGIEEDQTLPRAYFHVYCARRDDDLTPMYGGFHVASFIGVVQDKDFPPLYVYEVQPRHD